MFFKYPSTPHLIWLAAAKARNDKVLSPVEADRFLQNNIQVEEKVDGANIGISFDSDGALQIQNRGDYIKEDTKGQFRKLWSWIKDREDRLFDLLDQRFILFGEWCWAKHSINYTDLPDWFLAFDLFDKASHCFWPRQKRITLFNALNLASVPLIAEGLFTKNELLKLLGKSRFYDGPMEGVYCRVDDGDQVINRAKIVASHFTQSIHDHWTKQPFVRNQVDARQRAFDSVSR